MDIPKYLRLIPGNACSQQSLRWGGKRNLMLVNGGNQSTQSTGTSPRLNNSLPPASSLPSLPEAYTLLGKTMANISQGGTALANQLHSNLDRERAGQLLGLLPSE